jgi:AhpD family alkylhydroperoxidase
MCAAPLAGERARKERVMETRIEYAKVAPAAIQALQQVETYVARAGLPKALLELIKLRASQINGCAFCIDMHWKDARAHGESEQRLYGLSAWREAPYYEPSERAALAWTEALTLVTDGHVPDAAYAEVRAHWDDKQIVDLSVAIGMINLWNRLAIAVRSPAGTYQPRKL